MQSIFALAALAPADSRKRQADINLLVDRAEFVATRPLRAAASGEPTAARLYSPDGQRRRQAVDRSHELAAADGLALAAIPTRLRVIRRTESLNARAPWRFPREAPIEAQHPRHELQIFGVVRRPPRSRHVLDPAVASDGQPSPPGTRIVRRARWRRNDPWGARCPSSTARASWG